MKKKVLMIGLIFLLTGCTAKYDIKINFDKTVQETSNIIVDQSVLKSNDMGNSPKEFVTSILKILNQRSGSYKYHTNEIIDTSTMGFDARKNYKNIKTFTTNSPFAFYLYDGMQVTNNGTHIIVESIGKLKKEAINCNWCDYPELQDSYISIRLPYKVVNSNATSVDNAKNIYYWNLSANTNLDKIYFEYDTLALYSYNIIDWLPFLNYYIVSFVGVAIIIGLVVLVLYNRSKKNNII